MISPIILFQVIGLLLTTRAQSQSSWQFPLFRPSSGDLEREGSTAYVRQLDPVRSPALIGRQLAHLWSRNNGRLPEQGGDAAYLLHDTDQFQCLDPTHSLYQDFKRQYNRTYRDAQEEIERSQWFRVTLKRAILFNRIVQNQVLNRTDKAIRNYHFIEPKYGEDNLALWYADITDCELGLIKHNLFQIIHFVDTNQLQLALDIIHKHSDYLGALATDDGLEQLAEILLVRLFDRFRGDEKMNQLFQWPMYLKKLTTFAYSQQQAQQVDFKTKLELVAYAYPAYFKDVKYNHQAINRTQDNLRANAEHVAFNTRHGRKHDSLTERNRRLAIFRQRWTLVSQLNGEPPEGGSNSTRHLLPEWLRMQFPGESSARTEEELDAAGSPFARLVEPSAQVGAGGDSAPGETQKPFRLTQFSDLTDVEFQAFLSNDFSLLAGNKESADYLDKNFPLRPLDERLRWEVAHELELRRGASFTRGNIELLGRSGQFLAALDSSPGSGQQQQLPQQATPSLKLAKQVVDELISDVGLPLGPVTQEKIPEQEQMRVFTQVATYWQKSYLLAGSAASIVDERAKRFERFRENYGRFRAWFMKDGWRLDEAQSVSLLRLADLSWLELKTGLFKVCCLSEENLVSLSAINPTVQYLGSNYKILCGQLWPRPPGERNPPAQLGAAGPSNSVTVRLQERQRQQPDAGADEAELTARELYYYYSVHFNKHHASRQEAERHLNIFRRNIEAIRRHSCKRSLTLYESLRLNQTELLNTIDVLDPRRSHTDDLNLDRFEYFSLPGKYQTAARRAEQHASSSSSRLAAITAAGPAAVDIDTGRSGGFNYRRRDLFAPLLERSPSSQQQQQQQQASAEYQVVSSSSARLQDSWQSPSESAHKYIENNVAAIYNLVMSRYKFCMKQTKGIDLDNSPEPKLACKTDGALADQAVQLGATHEFLQQQQQQERDRCALYFQGLEPWSEDLIAQPSIVANSIVNARCQRA